MRALMLTPGPVGIRRKISQPKLSDTGLPKQMRSESCYLLFYSNHGFEKVSQAPSCLKDEHCVGLPAAICRFFD